MERGGLECWNDVKKGDVVVIKRGGDGWYVVSIVKVEGSGRNA